MPNFPISAVLLIAALGCILGSILIRARMVAEINSKSDSRSKLSFLDRDFLGMLDLHRKLYPKSNLRIATVLALVLLMVFGLSFTVVQEVLR
jgi:hypothetical protein